MKVGDIITGVEKKERGGRYSEDDAKEVMVHVLNVVAFCHLQGVVHKHLKPEALSKTLTVDELFYFKEQFALLDCSTTTSSSVFLPHFLPIVNYFNAYLDRLRSNFHGVAKISLKWESCPLTVLILQNQIQFLSEFYVHKWPVLLMLQWEDLLEEQRF
ncbi:hypothetical protein ACFE04_016474 [Oxalis oulophora]